MNFKNVSRREFVQKTGLLTGLGFFVHTVKSYGMGNIEMLGFSNHNITVSIDFVNGGGDVEIVDADPVIIKIRPHNEGGGGWSQVWWHFKIEGIPPGKEVALLLELGNPAIKGISPQ